MTSRGTLLTAFAHHLVTEPYQSTVTEWAEKYRIISEGADPGPFRSDKTPYTQKIADVCAANHPCSKVVVQGSNQIGKTVTLQNVIGERIHQSPCPILWVVPRDKDLTEFVANRIDPLREHTAVLRARIGRTESGERATHRTEVAKFPRGFIRFAGSKPAETFQQSAIAVVILDDYDRTDDNEDGDCVELAMKRTNTFSRMGAKVIVMSTPAIAPSKIAKEFEDSSQNHYYVPCPHCGADQLLEWAHFVWDSGRPDTAHFVCVHCQLKMHEEHKRDMLQGGQWRAHRPEYINKTEGFFIWAAYARTTSRTWAGIAESWEAATKKLVDDNDASALQVALNLDRAEVYYPPELVALHGAERDVYARREEVAKFHADAASRGVLSTAGTDKQADRLETAVYAWGAGAEGWLVDYQIHKGDTSKPDVWNEWATWLASTGAIASCVDGSDDTTVVCNELTRLLPQLAAANIACWAIKGQEGNGPIWPGRIDPGHRDPTTKRIRTVTIKVDELKSWVLGSLLRLKTPGPKFLHFSTSCSQKWMRQLFSWRARSFADKRGRSKHVRVYGRRRDEALDTTNYSLAALHARASAGCDKALYVLGLLPKPAGPPVAKPTSRARRPRQSWVTEPVL